MNFRRVSVVLTFVLVLVLCAGVAHAATHPRGPSRAFGDVVHSFAFPGGTSYRDMAFIGDAMYTCIANIANILQINPTNGATLATLPISATVTTGLAFDGEAFWIDDYNSVTVMRISRYDGTVLQSFPAPGGYPLGVTYDGVNLWNLDGTTPTLYKMDPTSGAVIDSFVLSSGAIRGLAYDGQLIWYGDSTNWLVHGLDPDTGAEVTSFAPPANTYIEGLGFDGQYLWVNTQDGSYNVTANQIDIEHIPCVADATCDDGNICTDDVCAGIGATVDQFLDATYDTESYATTVEGQIIQVTTDATLTGARMYLELTQASQTVAVAVYQASAVTGPYTFVYSKSTSLSGPDNGWQLINGMSYTMTAGNYYAIVFSWDTPGIVFRFSDPVNGTTYPVSFGNRVGDIDGGDGGGYQPATLPDDVIYQDEYTPHQTFLTVKAGYCANTNNTAPCDDGLFCTDPDVCADGVCTAGPARDCDDGLFCTGTETCNETTDTCDSEFDNVTTFRCPDDGLFCDGTESCDETADACVSSGDPCDVDQTCNETTDTCDENADDDTVDDDAVDDDATDDDTTVDDDTTTDDDIVDDDATDDDTTGGGDDSGGGGDNGGCGC